MPSDRKKVNKMEAKSITRYIHFSPYKARLVVDQIRGKKTEEALNILNFSKKKAAKIIGKTLRSAMANAQTNHSMNLEALYVSKAFVDQGPTWTRYMPRAMGRATLVTKPTSHITVVVKESEEILKKIAAEQAVKEEAKKQKGKKSKAAPKKAETGKAETAKKETSKTEVKKSASKKTETKKEN